MGKLQKIQHSILGSASTKQASVLSELQKIMVRSMQLLLSLCRHCSGADGYPVIFHSDTNVISKYLLLVLSYCVVVKPQRRGFGCLSVECCWQCWYGMSTIQVPRMWLPSILSRKSLITFRPEIKTSLFTVIKDLKLFGQIREECQNQNKIP